jgi:anhydro-N-acetylmuramic acid kinase
MRVLGLMSGTSLDGLDLALCEFEQREDRYVYRVLAARTDDYSPDWKARLEAAREASAEAFFALHADYGRYLSEAVLRFLKETGERPDAIASHGHTVFHQPQRGFSVQLGCGATIAAVTGLTTVCDFRSLDVAMGGQGAPLVPLGDALLFPEYGACLNIGGIANISYEDTRGRRLAYDICEANMVLNYLAERLGKAYDRGGEIARSGQTDPDLLTRWNALSYYSREGARSLGREWFEQEVIPLLDRSGHTEDLLATATEHVAMIIAAELERKQIPNLLVTGGGAFNTFLMERLKALSACAIVIPSEETVMFKEALIFAFLGHLRLNGRVNTLSSVTGALTDSVGGAVYSAS